MIRVASSAGRDVGPDPVGVGEQADLIAPEQGDVGQHQHRVEGVVERREPAAGVAGHHPAAVDQEHDPLALVRLVGPDGQLATAGGRLPVEVAGLVAVGVVAEPLELVVGPQPPRASDADGAQLVAAGQQGISADLANVGIDLDPGRDRPGHRPLPESQPAGDQGVDPLEFVAASPLGCRPCT